MKIIKLNENLGTLNEDKSTKSKLDRYVDRETGNMYRRYMQGGKPVYVYEKNIYEDPNINSNMKWKKDPPKGPEKESNRLNKYNDTDQRGGQQGDQKGGQQGNNDTRIHGHFISDDIFMDNYGNIYPIKNRKDK